MASSPTPPVVPAEPGTQADRFADIFRNSMNAAAPPAAVPDAGPEPATPVNEPAPEAVGGDEPQPAEPSIDLRSIDFEEEGASPAPEAGGEAQPPATPPAEDTKVLLESLRNLIESGYELPEDLEKALLGSPRGSRIYSAFKGLRMLGEPPEKGGLGFIPPVEDIRQWYTDANNWAALNHDFDHATDSFQANLFTPDQNGNLRPGVTPFLDTFLPNLYRHNREAFHRAVGPYIRNMFDAMRAEAATLPEGHNKDQYGVDERSNYDYAINIMQSKFFPDSPHAIQPGQRVASSTPTVQAAAGAHDPLFRREQALRQREEVIRQQQEGLVKSRLEQVAGALENAVAANIDADIDFICKKANIDAAKFNTPWMADQWRRQFRETVVRSVNGDPNAYTPPISPEGYRNYQIALSEVAAAARERPLGQNWSIEADPSAKRAVAAHRRLAQTAIRALAPQFITDALGTINGNHRAEIHQAAQTQREPQAGAPVQHSVVATPANGEALEIRPGENRTDAIARRFAHRITAQKAQSSPARSQRP